MLNKIINVLVVDDHQLIIDGMRSILQDEDAVQFAGGSNSVDEALQFLEVHPVDVILADISMPDKSGVVLTREVKSRYPDIQVLALTMHEDITTITHMIESGASGYILKRTNVNELLEAIQVVAEGGKYLGREVQGILMDNLTPARNVKQEPENTTAPLTAREKEVLSLVAREYTNEEIARKLFISERTVETHRRNIFTKTNSKSIVGLIKFAMKHHLIEQEFPLANRRLVKRIRCFFPIK